MKEKLKKKGRAIWCPEEMLNLIDRQRKVVSGFTYNITKNLSDTDMLRIIAHKIENNKLVP